MVFMPIAWQPKWAFRMAINIVSIGGKPVDNIQTVEAEIILSEAKKMQIERNGRHAYFTNT